ncbi:MAG: hypothetical protein BWX71_00895 [Deltaproteobacteria bacterium ADurb.Bin072]|nr:MAG: hypothetical protein BWX71_00895 [Deltaproteobacteria bacterium ADurb.Bin072]
MASLPVPAYMASPMPLCATHLRIWSPRLPLWDMMDSPPGLGPVGVGRASSQPWADAMPMVFGPMNTVPPPRAISTNSSSMRAPSSPISLNPDEMTTAVGIPLATHSRMTAGTWGAGMTSTARSTGSGMAVMLG